MNELESILREIGERELNLTVGAPHDNFRMSHVLKRNTVGDYREFREVTGDYTAKHCAFTGLGSGLAAFEAQELAKELLTRGYDRDGKSYADVCEDAIEGTNGGMRKILDMLCDGLKARSMGRYVENVFDRFIAPNSYDDRVEIVRQLFARFGDLFPSTINRNRPEEYASNYKILAREIVNARRRLASAGRRI